MLAEFHCHSTYSDGRLSIPELVDHFGQLGYGFLAITDHLCEEKTILGKVAAYMNHTLTRESFRSYIEEIKEQAERAKRLYQMSVVPGFEITKNSLKNHRSAHMLAIGIEEYISADLDVATISNKVRELGGLFVAAHPISMAKVRSGNYYLWDQRDELQKHFDAWEITDSGYLLEEVMKTDLPKLATTDFHHDYHMKSWKTFVETEKNPQAVLNAVRRQKDIRFQYLDLRSKKSQAA
jgi:predicted metal-dependent phosphoesterase TrpH